MTLPRIPGAGYRPVALRRLHTDAVAARLLEAGLAGARTRLLDYGCGDFDLGFALRARIAFAAGYDPDGAAIRRAVRRAAALRAGNLFPTTDRSAALARPATLAVLVSVAQYLPPAALGTTLAEIAAGIVPGGRILLVDVPPPGLPPVADALVCLRHAIPRGAAGALLAWQAAAALARTPRFFHAREAVARLAESLGLACAFAAGNFTPASGRYTAILTKL